MVHKENGSALVLTILIITVLLILSSALIHLYFSESRLSKHEENRKKAYYIAEAGIEYALTVFEKDSFWDEDGSLLPEYVDNISDLFDGSLTSLERSENEIIVSTGTSNNISVAIEIQVIGEESMPELDMAIYSDTDININNGTITGDLATNYGTITIKGWPTINGDMYIGPDSAPEDTVIYPPNYDLDSEIYNQDNSRTYTLPDFPAFPDDLPYRGDFTTPWVEGEYYEINQDGEYNLIQTSGHRTITIDMGGGDRIIRVKDLDIDQGHIELVNTGSGKLILYVEDSFTLNGSSSINKNGNPEDVFMYYKGSTQINLAGSTDYVGSIYVKEADISMKGSGGINGHILSGGDTINLTGGSSTNVRALLAPDSTVNVTGGASFRGSIVCDILNMSGGANITYEELSDISLPDIIQGGNSDYSVIWRY